MEELERKKDQDKHVPKFLHSTVPCLCSHHNKVTVSNSNLYTSKINEAQVCVGKSCFSKPESPACKTEDIRDNSKKEGIQDENYQDIYVPRFFIPPINIFSTGHAVDVDYAEIKSVNKAQVCVDDSFLSKSGSPDSESKEMESMGIERSIASDTKCSPDKDAFGTYDGLKKSERYTMTEGLAMKESMERLNESSSQSSSLHLKNRRRSASLRQKYQIHEMPKRKTQSFQPRKRSGKQLPLLKPPSASSITDPPEVQMNLAFELSQPIPGPSYTLGAQATPSLERLPSHQLQDLAERISVILKDRWGPQSHEEDKPTEDHDTPPTLPERPGKTETKDEFSSTYLEPVSISKNGAKETESASDEYQSNNPWNGGDHPDKLQCAQPQILSNPNAEVNTSTYIEPLKRNSSANESNKQVPLSLPSKPHKENHFQPYENASIGFNMKVPTSLEENSNTGCQTTTNTAKLYPVLGEDFNKIPQTLVNEAYKSQGAIPKVTRGNTHPGSAGKDVDALYQNHEMIKRPDPSPSVPETGQNRPDRMPAGFSEATPAPGNFVDQTEAKFAPQNGPLPPFFPNFMMAPQNQQIPMPNFMDPKYQQQQNIQGFPRTPYPGFPVPFFPFGQLPNQGNNIPQTGDKPTGSEGTFDTIRVRLKQPLTQDTLENYFENKMKSGGGDIDSLTIIKGTEMEVEEVLITFSESKDAMNCLYKQHMIDKRTLNVQKYDLNDPSLWEMDKALVTGLNPATTEDTLMNFLEPAAGVELKDLVRGAREDVAIVVSAEKPDFSKMSKRCKEKKLEGNTLFVQMVEKCQTIYVKGIDKSITYDLVENFFCNKRKSGGGDVEKVDYHPEDGYCIVYFENPSDAQNAAAKEKFSINDREIQAQMHFPCLGLPQQPMNWEDMPCVSYEGNEYIVKFVKNLPKECSQIEEALQKKFVKIEWPKSKSDFTVRLHCTVTKDVENAKEILKSWKEEAEAEMDRHMKIYACQKHSTVPEAWHALLAQLKTLTIDQPNRVAVLLDKKKHTVIVAGYEENTDALTRIILDLIRTEESKIQNQTEKIKKNIPLDFYKCQQLWKTHFGKKLANDFPDLDFQVEINKKEVNLTGKPAEVNEALIKMHEYLMNTKSKSLNISKGRYEIFTKKEVKERFIAEMKAKGNKAVWSVTEDKVEMTSLNSKMADEALDIFKELIPEKRIQMKDLFKVLTLHDWQACVKELRDKHDEKLSVSSSSSGVCVTATKDIFENVYKTIKHVLKICSEKCGIDCKVVKNYKR